MTISEILHAYRKATDKVSEIVRQLNFAGIAIFWIFRAGKDNGGISYSTELLLPLCLFVASLTCDLLQYIYKSLIWGLLNTHYWRIYHNNAANVKISGLWNWPTLALFWSKIFIALAGYFCLLKFLWPKI